MNRFSRLLGEFSRNSRKAKLTQQLNKKVEAPEANANGTSGYLIKEGKNAGKVLKHLINLYRVGFQCPTQIFNIFQ
jgi:hypothetical protein